AEPRRRRRQRGKQNKPATSEERGWSRSNTPSSAAAIFQLDFARPDPQAAMKPNSTGRLNELANRPTLIVDLKSDPRFQAPRISLLINSMAVIQLELTCAWVCVS